MAISKEDRQRLRQAEIDRLTEKYSAQVRRVYNLTIVSYQSIISGTMRPCLKIWRGSAYHPLLNCWCVSEEQRQKTIDNYISGAESTEAYKAKKQRERREYLHDMKIGDIFVSSWGYDQTNVDFYEVTAVHGKSVTVREIAQKTVPGSEGFMSSQVLPCPGEFLERAKPMRKLVQHGGSIKIDHHYAHPWKGQKQYCSWYA